MKLFLHFPKDIVDKPIITALIKEHGAEVNILRARVTQTEDGEMVVDIGPDPESAIVWLKERGVAVYPLSDKIARRDELCVDCGSCSGVCPSGALCMGEDDRLVFDSALCIFCLFCLDSCPTGALEAFE
ncbi:MAG: NIL domain-containing protein [candidate division WOR-3 bacterium]